MSLGGTDAYAHAGELPPLVQRALHAARSHGFAHSCRPEQGRLLRVLAGGAAASIGETGTGCGVGLAWLASGAQEGVRLVSVERDGERARAAAEVFADVPGVRMAPPPRAHRGGAAPGPGPVHAARPPPPAGRVAPVQGGPRPQAGRTGQDRCSPGPAGQAPDMAVTAGTHTETERTYDAPAPGGLPRLAGVAGVAAVEPADSEHLDAVYHDTQDLRLLARGITLRRREGGHDAGWHLKLPVGGGSKREVRLPLDAGPPGAVPGELAGLVAGITRGRELRPVARLRTRRRRSELRDKRGRELAELAEDHVTAQVLLSRGRDGAETEAGQGEWTESASWQEVEVELAGAGPDLLDAVEEQLAAAGLHRAPTQSKLARALGDRIPRRTRPHRDRPRGSAGAVVLARLREQADAMLAWDPAVRRDEPDSVHRMRVATRRLRAALKSYPTVLDRHTTDPVEAELAWLAGVLGEARDREVLGERLAAQTDAIPGELVLGPVRARITSWSAAEYRTAHQAVLDALGSPRYFALLDSLDALLVDPPLLPGAGKKARRVLTEAALHEHRRTARRVTAALDTEPGPRRDAALHRARKAAKRARYAGETARPVLGKRAKKFARRMADVHRLLGVHQDAVVTRTALRDLAVRAHGAGENGFTYGLLLREQTAAADAVERELPGVWAHSGKRKHARLRR
jgi:CHAD domain-containing protein